MGIFERKGKIKNITVPAHTVTAPGRADDSTTAIMINETEEWITDVVCFGKRHKLPTEGTTMNSTVGRLKVTVTGRGQYEVRKV